MTTLLQKNPEYNAVIVVLCVESFGFTAVIYKFIFRHQPVLQGAVLFVDIGNLSVSE